MVVATLLASRVDAAFVHEALLEGRPPAAPGQPFAVFGTHVAASGDTLVVAAYLEDTAGGVSAGAVYVFVRSGSAWVLQQRLTAPDPSPEAVFGRPVSISGDTLVVGSTGADTTLPDTGAAYVFVRTGTTWSLQQKLAGSGIASGDDFGYGVSVSGDTAVVSAQFADTPTAANAGAAWVFVRSGTTWTEQQKLVASDGAPYDYFVNVAVSGDTIVVGADSDNTPAGVNTGSAYVFVRSGTTWTEQQHLTASDAAPEDYFGWSVAISGDTIVVGARDDDGPAGTNQGSAYVFVRTGTTWDEQQKLVAPDAAANDLLGLKSSISGDTIVLGVATRDTPAGADVGTAYVFVRSGTAWTLQQTLTASDGLPGDAFGRGAAVAGDTIVVGSPAGTLPGADDGGKAYVFERSGAAWNERQVLRPVIPRGEDRFGTSTAVFGDTALVGAIAEDWTNGIDAGAAYVFVRSGASWTEQAKLRVPETYTTGFAFGHSVALHGDTAIVGAPTATSIVGAAAGRAYVFQRSGATWSVQSRLAASDGAAFGGFGTGVSVFGNTAVVGAVPSTGAQGAAYVYGRSGPNWTFLQKLLSFDHAPGDAFGASVALADETTMFVGTPRYDAATAADAGAVYLFRQTGLAWLQQQRLTPSDAAAGDEFGRSLAVSGDTLLVGSSSGGGSVYVFTRTGATWTQQQKLLASDGAGGDLFGDTVSVAGDVALVGAPGKDTPAGPDAGAAYVFGRSGSGWTEHQRLLAPDAATGNGFGHSVAVYGSTALVGQPLAETSNGVDVGTAHVFRTVAAADLAVALTAAPDPVGVQQPLAYTIAVANLGPAVAQRVSVSVVWTAGASFQGASGVGWACSRAAGTVTCTRPSLDAGTAPDVTVVLTAPTRAGTITTRATVTHAGSDPVPANDVASRSTLVVEAADLSLTLSGSPDPVRAEGEVEYTIEVRNLGPSTSSGLAVTDTLAPGSTYSSSNPGPPTCTHANGTVTCALGALPVSSSHRVTVRATVDPSTLGAIDNAASVSGQELDPATGNNSDSLSTLVLRLTEGELSQGAQIRADLSSVGGALDQDLYAVTIEPHASYEVVVDATSGDIGLGQGPALERLDADGTTVLQSSVAVGTGPSRSLRWINTTGAEVGQYVRVRSQSCVSDCAADDVYRIRARETTCRIPRFNNSTSQVTVVLLHNTGPDPVSGRIAFWNRTGALLHEEAFSLGRKALLTLDTAGVPALQGETGSMTVSHDGALGTLVGKAVALEPATGFTFDSLLETRAR